MTHPSEHDFSGTVDQWEERVFLNAAYFRVHRFYGQGQHDSTDADTFETAVRTVGSVRQDKTMPGARATIYAVTASGRFTMLAEKYWLRYLQLSQAAA
jgi:hypothetical protein